METPETPKSPERTSAEKKEEIIKKLDSMLDWQIGEKIKKALLPQLDNLTSEEMDYCLELVRKIDNQTQLRGPLASTARDVLAEQEITLNEIAQIIGVERAEELKSLME